MEHFHLVLRWIKTDLICKYEALINFKSAERCVKIFNIKYGMLTYSLKSIDFENKLSNNLNFKPDDEWHLSKQTNGLPGM